MKKALQQLFCQYKLLVLFNVIMIIGAVLSSVMGDIYVVQNEVLSYNLYIHYCMGLYRMRFIKKYSILNFHF